MNFVSRVGAVDAVVDITQYVELKFCKYLVVLASLRLFVIVSELLRLLHQKSKYNSQKKQHSEFTVKKYSCCPNLMHT